MKSRIITTSALTIFTCAIVSAQGFANFKVEGALTATLLKNNTKTASLIETIVPADVDIKTLPVKYKLLSSCSVDESTPLDNDYTNAKHVVITKKDGTSKEWNINVHQLVPASLPLEIAFSKSNPCSPEVSSKPWAGYGLDYSKPTVARMGNDGIGLFAAYDAAASEVKFDLTVVGGAEFKGEFDVETSVDGKKWSNLKTYKAGSFTGTETFTLDLPADARYVRWIYALREEKQNVNLNNIRIK
jgi:hypothetical protein